MRKLVLSFYLVSFFLEFNLSAKEGVIDNKSTAAGARPQLDTQVVSLSSDKANETITEKINRRTFYIEEGGMLKEIITTVKAGKVILDEKGKPLFEKSEEDRILMLHERAHYKNLKEITRGAL